MSFPPVPLFPDAIDTDFSLFKVYNTSEAQLSANNQPWSQEVLIEPVGDDTLEIWSDNGFANISGELFYYGSVQKNSAGKVFKLKKCARNIGGRQTQANPAGTWVRGFVVAEHHKQLSQALLNLETFVGINFSEDRTTLDWRIRNLNAEPIGDDDYQCPDVTLEFEVTSPSTDGGTSTTISYNLTINGFFTSFILNFGDGTSTTSAQAGTHVYAPNANIDPIATVSNDKCQIVQSGITRTNPEEPQAAVVATTFEINVPDVPDFPTVVVPNIVAPETTLTMPTIQMPCPELGSIGDINVDIPSIITIEPAVPSIIEFGPVDIPSNININTSIDIPSTINFGPVDIPENISFGPAPAIPSVILFSPIDIPYNISFSPIDIPSMISFGPVSIPSNISVIIPSTTVISVTGLSTTIPGSIQVYDDIPSTIMVQEDIPDTIAITGVTGALSTGRISVTGTTIPTTITVSANIPPVITLQHSFLPYITLIGEIPGSISVEWGSVGSVPRPSVSWGNPPTVSCVVSVTCPGSSPFSSFKSSAEEPFVDSMDSVDLDMEIAGLGIPSEIKIVAPNLPDLRIKHDLPAYISVEVPPMPDIYIVGPDIPIPSEIKILMADDFNIPSQIELISDLPQSILLDGSNIPSSIKLDVPDNFGTIRFEGNIPSSIQVVGIPDHIELIGTIPNEININVKPLENLEIPLVYKGGPLPVQFTWNTPAGEAGDMPCFALVPCPAK